MFKNSFASIIYWGYLIAAIILFAATSFVRSELVPMIPVLLVLVPSIGWVLLSLMIIEIFFNKKLSINPNHNRFVFHGAVLVIAGIISHASVFRITGLAKDGVVLGVKSSDALYFSIVTWTTLGYGDFAPIAASRLFAASEAMMGYVTMTILIGLILNSSKQNSD